jgi:hypothetical protein
LVGGFNSFGGIEAHRIMRLRHDGSVDPSFLAGSGFDPDLPFNSNVISFFRLTATNRLLVAGWFTTFNGAAVPPIVRLNADGTLDSTFTLASGYLTGPANGVLLQEDDRAIIWTAGHNTSNGRIMARVNPNGSLDSSFEFLGLNSADFVQSAALADSGHLYVSLSNRGEILRSAPALAPALGTPLANRTVAPGGNITFTASVLAVPAPTYQWFKNGGEIPGATGPSRDRPSPTPWRNHEATLDARGARLPRSRARHRRLRECR